MANMGIATRQVPSTTAIVAALAYFTPFSKMLLGTSSRYQKLELSFPRALSARPVPRTLGTPMQTRWTKNEGKAEQQLVASSLSGDLLISVT